MMTLRQLSITPKTIPAATAWYLADLGEALGKQQLHVKQSPQKLKALREHALIESAVSSNRIEGVDIDQARVATVVFGRQHLRDRNEEEVRRYREALDLIHKQGKKLPLTENTILDIHRAIRGRISDAGKYKERDGDIIERTPDGRERVRFKTVEASRTTEFMRELLEMWDRCLLERWVHPLIALAAFNLDFLCIHPFRDGNGRASRLLILLQCYHLGFEVGRYISLERLIEENKERYYETLEASSHRWRQSKHDPWPYINYLLFILKSAYNELEERIGRTPLPKGAKTEMVEDAVARVPDPFRIADLQRQCPGVSVDLIRQVLKRLQSDGRAKCIKRGRSAEWQKTSKGRN